MASAIAARAGAPVTPQPFEPVLRGMLLTEHQPRWLRDDAAAGQESAAAGRGLWWPPTKIAGRWLAPYLLGRDKGRRRVSRRRAADRGPAGPARDRVRRPRLRRAGSRRAFGLSWC